MIDLAVATQSLKHVAVADVHKKGVPAAVLRRGKDGASEFSYLGTYRDLPIASTLPVVSEPTVTPAGALPPFFAGLLPEGRRLVAIQRATKTSVDDELTLLLAVGQDTVGDVQIVPQEHEPKLPAPMASSTELATLSFKELFEKATGATIDRTAIPGIQHKVSASDMLSVPVGVGPVPCILKLNPPDFPFLVENEAFFLAAARRFGIATASARLVRDVDHQAGLLVRRFDRRITTEGKTLLLAQEDGCQANRRYPADKNNLTTEETIEALTRLTAAPKVAAFELMRQVAFGYLIGNGDLHAKNLSVVEVDSEYRASPGYDVLSTYPYNDTTMALSLAGKNRENITRRSFLSAGESVGVRAPAIERMLDGLLHKLPGLLAAIDQLPFDARRKKKLARLIEDRGKKLAA